MMGSIIGWPMAYLQISEPRVAETAWMCPVLEAEKMRPSRLSSPTVGGR
jgi:hypothetical protein